VSGALQIPSKVSRCSSVSPLSTEDDALTTSTVVSDVAPAKRPRGREDTQPGYRLDVVASDVADVGQSAGGWLYVRMAAGIRCRSEGLPETFLSDLRPCLPVDSDLEPAAARTSA